MISFAPQSVSECVIHWVGNKCNMEPLVLSPSGCAITDDLNQTLTSLLLGCMGFEELWKLSHESDIRFNQVHESVRGLFSGENGLQDVSVHFAQHLFACGTHPRVKPGELFVARFDGCSVDGRRVAACGIFKFETKKRFVTVSETGGMFGAESTLGLPAERLDKGAVIFDTEQGDGYLVAVVDNTNKGSDAQYWTEDFLGIEPRRDEYHSTKNALALCKQFITDELPAQFDVTRADQADLLNRSVRFFKEHDSFQLDEFAQEVMQQPEVIDRFTQYRSSFEDSYGLEVEDGFAISAPAVKKQARAFKSVLKLDKNFHIYIHGDRDKIEQGVDERGRKYYKIFYEEES